MIILVFLNLNNVDKRYNFNSSRYNNFYINNSLMAVNIFYLLTLYRGLMVILVRAVNLLKEMRTSK